MASIAEQIIKDNGFDRQIRVVRKRSTDMSVEDDMDGRRANILGQGHYSQIVTYTEGFLLESAMSHFGTQSQSSQN